MSSNSNIKKRILTSDKQSFKECSCKTSWDSRNDFLSDPDINLIGYQVNFNELELGLFYFNHDRNGCYSTLAIYANNFKDLYDGPVYENRLTNTKSCSQYCQNIDILTPCPKKCECAWVREIIQIIQNWPPPDTL